MSSIQWAFFNWNKFQAPWSLYSRDSTVVPVYFSSNFISPIPFSFLLHPLSGYCSGVSSGWCGQQNSLPIFRKLEIIVTFSTNRRELTAMPAGMCMREKNQGSTNATRKEKKQKASQRRRHTHTPQHAFRSKVVSRFCATVLRWRLTRQSHWTLSFCHWLVYMEEKKIRREHDVWQRWEDVFTTKVRAKARKV